MSLSFYDENKDLFGIDPLRTFFDGHLGGAAEKLIYIRNDDINKYYHTLILKVQMESMGDWGEFGDTGWGIKLIKGERQPTEAEWDIVRSGDDLSLPDIGSISAGDTSTYIPVWIRAYCPGNTSAQIRNNIRLSLSTYSEVI